MAVGIQIKLEDYREVVPRGTIEQIRSLSERLRGRSVVNVNSTRHGGGVAEILNRLIPLLQEVGVEARWEVVRGTEEFFQVTKRFHNALQGWEQTITDEMLEVYKATNRENVAALDLDADVVFIHDPQPAALIDYRKQNGSKWIWRCHIDASRPQRRVWNFLRQYIVKYDAAIFSLPKFAQRLPIPQFRVYPSIDPLSEKNRELSNQEVERILDRLGVPRDKPILLQVSRFDRFKDPLGVIRAYRLVKKYHPCRLVLAGGGATDDPEGQAVLNEVKEAAADDSDIIILDLPPTAHLEINALQRAAAIVFQKSIREGFGLTVAEAMWKGKPVIGGYAGGITVQLIHGITGYLVNSVEGAAFWARYLLNNPDVMERIGHDAREYARSEFLITRHLADYMAIMVSLLS